MINNYKLLFNLISNRNVKEIYSLLNKSKDLISYLKNGLAYAEQHNIEDMILFFSNNINMLEKDEATNISVITLEQLIETDKYKKEIEKALKATLTEEQCAAIFNDDNASLIVAGAGCGKTTTALGKIVYLVNSRKAELDEILPIYFNKANAAEMNDKITAIFGNTQKIAYDYHQLGLKILETSCSVKTSEEVIREIFNGFLKDEKYENLIFRIFNFIVRYMYSDEERALNVFPDYFDDLSIEQKIETLANDCITLKGEHVKSAPEAVIANFLFTHNIPYVYEKWFKSCYPEAYPMRPDFYVPLDNRKDSKNAVWIEHWGIEKDSQGNERVRWLNPKGEKEYIENKQKKLETYKTCGAKLIELFLSDFKENELENKLKEQLEKFGVNTSREMTREERIRHIKELIKSKKLGAFQEKVQNCINLLKINKYKSEHIKDIYKKALSGLGKREKERVIEFYRIVYLIMKEYEKKQKEENFIDFTDMLINALPKVYKTDFKYKYIIIDEYQDIDNLNYELISAIQKKTNAKICCVGDDWQAIYRFKGGNLDFFSNFGRYFPNFKTYRIQQTFRNGAPLIDIAGRFVQKNDNQLKKTIRSDKRTFLKAVRYHEFETRGETKDVDRLNCLFQILQSLDKAASILIIVRNNSDFNKYFDCLGENCNDLSGVQTALQRKFSNKKINVRTAHSSKGLEYDYVVVFNTAFRVTGFPSLLDDDPAISFLLPDKEDYSFAEERRLFYVALTRAKKGCYLLVPKFEPSVFFSEIKNDLDKDNIIESYNAILATCPWCGKEMERITRKDEPNKKFYRCSSYPVCKFSAPKAFIVKKCNDVERLIKEKIEDQNRPASVFVYNAHTDELNVMNCNSIENEADEQSLNRSITRDIDIYIVFDDFKDYSKLKNCLVRGREPVPLNFSENDLDTDLLCAFKDT